MSRSILDVNLFPFHSWFIAIINDLILIDRQDKDEVCQVVNLIMELVYCVCFCFLFALGLFTLTQF